MGLKNNSKVYYYKGDKIIGGNRGKRISIYITLILPNRALNRWFLVEYYRNSIFVRFLVSAVAISA